MALAALSGFCAVAVGAFAAHGVTDPRAQELLRTGAQYQMTHALAVLVCGVLVAQAPRARFAPGFFLGGTVLFSGSLYAMAAGAPRWLGAITPIGGVLFLVGWLALAWTVLSLDRPDSGK